MRCESGFDVMEQGIHLLLTEDQWIIQNVEDLKIELCDFIDDQVRHHEDGWENTKIQSASTADGKLHFNIFSVIKINEKVTDKGELLVTIERKM